MPFSRNQLRFWVAGPLIVMAYAAASAQAPTNNPPSPVAYASANEMNNILTQVRQMAQSIDGDLGKTRIEKWKADSGIKRDIQGNVESVRRNLQTALPEMVTQLGLTKFTGGGDVTLFHAKGCAQCSNTGYMGRFCILEMLPMTDPLRSLVMKHATSSELKAEAQRGGMLTMYEDGMRKAIRGDTTFEEVLRVTREA